MQTVNVTELQTNLIAWLERVRAGEEVLVSDLNRPIARLLPVEISDEVEAEELEMMEAPVVAIEDIVAAVRAERDED